MFTELSKFPIRAKRFRDTMDAMSKRDGYEPDSLFNAFPWSSIDPKTFVDVGGSTGKMSVFLAERLKSLRCIVQDLPEVIAGSDSTPPAHVASRVKFMAHDFFTEQPVKGADVYFLRWILHDWSDKYCLKILRSLVPALKNGARIIVGDMLVPKPGALSKYQEWIIR